MKRKKYYVGSISYCFPYDFRRTIQSDFGGVCHEELLGVLEKYSKVYMSEREADKFICDLILKHPYMEDSMELTICIMRSDGKETEFYHIITIKNDSYSTNNKIYKPSPVQWRYEEVVNNE